MKFPIKWHKDGLHNMQMNLLAKMEAVQRANADADRLRRDIIAYDAQIIEAEARGITEFDSEKFGKKRKAAA